MGVLVDHWQSMYFPNDKQSKGAFSHITPKGLYNLYGIDQYLLHLNIRQAAITSTATYTPANYFYTKLSVYWYPIYKSNFHNAGTGHQTIFVPNVGDHSSSKVCILWNIAVTSITTIAKPLPSIFCMCHWILSQIFLRNCWTTAI